MMLGLLACPRAAAEDRFHGLREEIRQALTEHSTPSIAVAVAQNGAILWEEGFGWADRERLIPADENTMYSLASISKPMTATGLMVLVQRGVVDLERAANEYLEDAKLRAFVGDANEATVRRLANHTSGLPLHYQFFYDDQPHARPSMEVTIRRYGVLVTPPGEHYQYANFGYGVLDYIIERKAGKSFERFMREEVFLPLDMNRTFVGVPSEVEQFAAARYGPEQNRLPFYDFDHRGASAVYSSAHDLVRFGMFHLKQRLPQQKQILSDEMLDAMVQDPVETGRGTLYGVGWTINPDERGYRTVSHSGGMGGVRTILKLVPEEQLVVVVLCNSETELRQQIEQKILEEMLPSYRERSAPQAQNADSASGGRAHRDAADDPEFQPSEDLQGLWIGKVRTWEGEHRLELRILPSGDVHVRLADQLKTLLNKPRFANGALSGVFAGDIQTEDANRRPYHLHLDVRLRGNTMNGAVTALSLPGSRLGNALSSWVELKKEDQP